MLLTEEAALRAYARMLNTLDVGYLEPLLAEDFTYESQMVVQPIESKQAFLDYIRRKLKTIERKNATLFAEMAMVSAYFKYQPCVVVAQNERDNLVGIVLARTEGSKLKRLDLCVIPPPQSAQRTGDYPS